MNWDFIRSALAVRRDKRNMERKGFSLAEVDWSIIRGSKYDHEIQEVQISADRKHVWYKTAPKTPKHP